jgi:hypothetical protein
LDVEAAGLRSSPTSGTLAEHLDTLTIYRDVQKIKTRIADLPDTDVAAS